LIDYTLSRIIILKSVSTQSQEVHLLSPWMQQAPNELNLR
jgi:hypothetical protein